MKVSLLSRSRSREAGHLILVVASAFGISGIALAVFVSSAVVFTLVAAGFVGGTLLIIGGSAFEQRSAVALAAWAIAIVGLCLLSGEERRFLMQLTALYKIPSKAPPSTQQEL